MIILLLHNNFKDKIILNNYFISVIEFIGKISFGIYAYHYVIFKIFPLEKFNLLFILLFTLLFSALSYFIYEPFFLNFNKGKK
jgi:peptidoglycan/LPS O-acetylase OafA/YrhL